MLMRLAVQMGASLDRITIKPIATRAIGTEAQHEPLQSVRVGHACCTRGCEPGATPTQRAHAEVLRHTRASKCRYM